MDLYGIVSYLVIYLNYEIFESMDLYGIVSYLVIYLTTKLHEGTLNPSQNVN